MTITEGDGGGFVVFEKPRDLHEGVKFPSKATGKSREPGVTQRYRSVRNGAQPAGIPRRQDLQRPACFDARRPLASEFSKSDERPAWRRKNAPHTPLAEERPQRDCGLLILYVCFYQSEWPKSTTIFGHPAEGGVAENRGLTATAQRAETRWPVSSSTSETAGILRF